MSDRHWITVPGSFPGWFVHAGAVVAAAATGSAVLAGGWWPLIAVALTAVGVFTRVFGAAVLGVGALLIAILMSEPSGARTAVVVFGVHALVVLASLASWIPLTSRVVPAALLPTAARFLWMQGIGQGVALVTGLLVPVEGHGVPLFAVVGGIALAVLATAVGWLWATALADVPITHTTTPE